MRAPRAALATSAWCSRTRGCSAAPSATTSRTATPTPPRSRSSRPRRPTYVDRFVHSLPDGYDTVIDDEGGNISAGEKQLITIARAFLADPAILILDEATSSVDTRTEVLIQQAMAALRSRPHELRDRPPAVDDPRRRPDPRDGARPASSSRARTTSCSPPTARTPASTTRSSSAPWTKAAESRSSRMGQDRGHERSPLDVFDSPLAAQARGRLDSIAAASSSFACGSLPTRSWRTRRCALPHAAPTCWRARGSPSSGARTGSRPPSPRARGRADRTSSSAPSTTRCPASAMPAGTTSSPRRPSGRGSPWPPSPRTRDCG